MQKIRVSEVREKASYEEDQKCPHFGVCGGCSSQTIPYEKQLELKVEQVKDLFKEAEVPTGEFLGIETSPIQWEYRNKMEYTFGDEEKRLENFMPWNAYEGKIFWNSKC